MFDQDLILIATSVTYYNRNDETAFFEWLARIPCFERCEGRGRDLFIQLSRLPTDDDLRELIAFFQRYEIDMRQLARFGAGTDRAWFREPKMSWHKRVFGGADRRS